MTQSHFLSFFSFFFFFSSFFFLGGGGGGGGGSPLKYEATSNILTHTKIDKNMCVCVFVCLYVYVCIYICTYMYVYICVYISSLYDLNFFETLVQRILMRQNWMMLYRML